MDQRRTRRFNLKLPLSITRSGAQPLDVSGHTENISSTGVLFTSGSVPVLGRPIEYVIQLHQDEAQSANIRCMGKILRSMPTHDTTGEFQVAATLERYEFLRGE